MILELRCLGALEILIDGKPTPHFKTRKVQALLVYLAYHPGRFFPREHLQTLLWSESAPKQAAASLRQALANLRRVLAEEMLLFDLGALAFNPESEYALDVFQVYENPSLYRGPFLQGFDLSGAYGWEEWLFTTREQIQSRVMDRLEAQGQQAAAQGHISSAIETFRRMVRIDSWREDIHRALMRLYDLAGDRPAALAQYEKCCAILTEEVGVEPTVETTALYQRILLGEAVDPPTSALLGDRAPPSPQLPFVGREKEAAQLKAAWEQARRGQGHLTLIEGEVGLGKTRLAEEMLQHAAEQGAVVARGRCYEFGSGVPYQPLIEVLRPLLLGEAGNPFPRPLAALSPVWLAEIASLLPDLRELTPNRPPPGAAENDTDPEMHSAARQRLFEAVAQALAAVLSSRKKGEIWQPLALFLDDLHWIDQTTLDLFHFLIRRLEGATIWFLGAYRREEMELAHPLLQMRRSLSRDRRVSLVQLEPLSLSSIAQGVQGLTGLDGAGAQGLGSYLGRESEGNPFILSELLYHLTEQNALHWSAHAKRWNVHGDWSANTPRLDVPFAVREVILARVARLSRPGQELLQLAAVIGRAFALSLLRAAARLGAEGNRDAASLPVEASVESWLARRLLRAQPTAGADNLLDFAHDMIRAVVYHTTDPIRRALLHQRVGLALEELHTEQLSAVHEQLAYHFEQAGAAEKAPFYLALAGDKAAALYAHSEALDYYNRALAFLSATDARRWDVALRQVVILRLMGEYEQAIARCRGLVGEAGAGAAPLFWRARAANELSEIDLARRNFADAHGWAEQALQWTENLAETEPAALEVRAQAMQLQGKVAREEGRLDAAQALFEAALALHTERENPQGAVDCLNGLGQIFSSRGYYDAALARFEEVLVLYRSLADQRGEATCLRIIGRVCWRMGDNERAQHSFDESLALCRAIGDRRGEAESTSELGLIHISLGESEAARACWEESVAIFRLLGLEKRIAPALHNLGIVYITQGKYAIAQRQLEESLALNRADGALPVQALDLGWLGLLAYQRGDYPQAEAHLEAALALDAQMDGSEEIIWHLTWMGMVYCETGRLEKGEEYLLAARQQAGERGIDRRLHEVYQWLALIALARGDGPAALAAAQIALSGADAGANEHALLGIVHSSGLLEAPEDPLVYFRQAVAMEDFNPFKRGMVLRRYGTFLLKRGEEAEGLAYLRQAQAIFQEIGAQGELKKVEKHLPPFSGGDIVSPANPFRSQAADDHQQR